MADLAAFLDLLRTTAVALAGTAALAALVAVVLSAGYRAVTTRSPPAAVVPLVALGTVTGYLTVTLLTADRLLEGVPVDHHYSAGYLLATVLLCGTAAVACSRLGDRVTCQVVDLPRIDADGDGADALRSARLAVACELPVSIDRAAGYRPVDPETRESIAGSIVRLPHGRSLASRRDRLETHLERAYDVDEARVELADDGSVERVLVGRRPTGLGSLLPPGTVVVGVRTQHPLAGGLGDPVECWSTGDEPRLVATGTLHSSAGTVATVVVDRDRFGDLTATDRYCLVTSPEEPTDGHAFAGTLRTAEETVVAWTVESGGPLAGEFVGWLPGRVLVIVRGDDLLAMPEDSETLRPDDRLWLLAAPGPLAAFDPENRAERGEDEPSSDDIDREREPLQIDA